LRFIDVKEFSVSQDEKGNWIVTSDKIPGFVARGGTQQEAVEKMIKAFRMYYPCGECKDK
jgi:predicted RNase H-like HicB family nuclease